jgi:hypothetical protein
MASHSHHELLILELVLFISRGSPDVVLRQLHESLHMVNHSHHELLILELVLFISRGSPDVVIRQLHESLHMVSLSFDQDSAPIWLDRDNAVKNYCLAHKVNINWTFISLMPSRACVTLFLY